MKNGENDNTPPERPPLNVSPFEREIRTLKDLSLSCRSLSGRLAEVADEIRAGATPFGAETRASLGDGLRETSKDFAHTAAIIDPEGETPKQ